SGKIIFANQAMWESLGYTQEAFLNSRVWDWNPTLDEASWHIARTQMESESVFEFETVHQRITGELIPVSVRAMSVSLGDQQAYLGIAVDLTEQHRAQRDVQEERERLALVLKGSNLGLWDWNPDTGDLVVDARWAGMLGYSLDEIAPNVDSWSSRVHPADLPRCLEDINAHIEGRSDFYTNIHRMQHKDGRWIYIHDRGRIMERNDQGKPVRFVGTHEDVTEAQEQSQIIEKLAFYDPVTGLHNRQYVNHKLIDFINANSENSSLGAILVVDLDGFKYINDSLGHRVGDLLLCDIANRLRDFFPQDSSLARLSGDEFLIYLPDVGVAASEPLAHVELVMSELANALAQPSDALNGRTVTSCLGGVLLKQGSADLSELMRHADLALQAAKRSGVGKSALFDEAMSNKLMLDEHMAHDLFLALGTGEQIEAWFQPKLDNDRKIAGFEALARWRHPTRGIVPPDKFIELAERKGLISRLGELMLFKSCQQMVGLRKYERLQSARVAVNISQAQLADPVFPRTVSDILQTTGLPAEALRLEVTETMLADDLDTSIERMNLIRELGVSFSLDDFGTGYSSLSYLRRLPICELKIDRSFVQDVYVDDEDRAIVTSIILMGRALKLSIVAEGIESDTQLTILKTLGASEYQGYLFCKPLPVADLITRLHLDRKN
ncbi:MAG TPA: EAL domain-containing protein, partial [Marinobacterium sp.]|nr:EAL domain-containing protein [Marinobacterium sp.]